MSVPRRLLPPAAALALVSLLVVVFRREGAEHAATSEAGGSPSTSFDPWDAHLDPRTRLLVVGGGGEPRSTEVQLELDAQAAVATYGGPSVVLFAGGGDRATVRELDRGADAARDPVFAALSALFVGTEPDSRLRRPRLRVDASATYDHVLHALDELLMPEGTPLTLLVATHGEGGATPGEGYALLWGNEAWLADDLVDLLGQPSTRRPTRLVVASCHGGSFAEIATLLPRAAESVAHHCGVFATDADRLASGCDPDPDRARHEGYLLHYLAALTGQDRSGRVDPTIDLDRDGAVGMLEAHTHARIAARSFDVPITTSERYVRGLVTERELAWESVDPEPLPEERAVVAALSRITAAPTEAVARAAHRTARQSLEESEEALFEAEAMRELAWNRLRVALLERFPYLEDAYDPAYVARVRRDRGEVAALLRHSELATDWHETSTDAESIAAEVDALRLREAGLARLVAAYDLERMVAALRANDPEGHARFLALRACERFVPELAGRRR